MWFLTACFEHTGKLFAVFCKHTKCREQKAELRGILPKKALIRISLSKVGSIAVVCKQIVSLNQCMINCNGTNQRLFRLKKANFWLDLQKKESNLEGIQSIFRLISKLKADTISTSHHWDTWYWHSRYQILNRVLLRITSSHLSNEIQNKPSSAQCKRW